MADLCTRCERRTGFVNGKRSIDGKPYCDDCYFGKLGEIFELHPIGFNKPE